MQRVYATKAELARMFGMSPPTIYSRVAGIQEQIRKGRYNRYAIADKLISVAVFVDYEKYHRRLEKGNSRERVPDYDEGDASKYLMEVKNQ